MSRKRKSAPAANPVGFTPEIVLAIAQDCADHDSGPGAVQRAPDGRLHHRCRRHLHPKWPCVAITITAPGSGADEDALLAEGERAGIQHAGDAVFHYGYGDEVAPHVVEDRAWFAERPARKFRLRPRRPSETEWPAETLDGDTSDTWMLVMRGAAGGRLRLPLCIGHDARDIAESLAADTGEAADRFLAFLVAHASAERTDFPTLIDQFNAAERLAGHA